MLTKNEIYFADRNGLDVENIQAVYPNTGIVVLKDGTEHQLCEIITRVMGYHRPVQDWNKGKQSEYAERMPFKEDKCNLDKERNANP